MALISDYDDRTLVERHCGGDDRAFRTIVMRHGASLHSHALRRTRDPVLAEDAVQETLLRAYLALDRFEGDYRLDAWLHRILTNVCRDIGRRQGRDSRLFDRACGRAELTAPPADVSLEAPPRDDVADAFDSLPDTYREALLLRFVDDLTYEEVAQKAGISEENARARVSRGRTLLRRFLDGGAAALLWLIPPLRRNQLNGSEADIAANSQVIGGAAPQVQAVANTVSSAAHATPALAQTAPVAAQAAPAFSGASGFLAQAAPALAQAAPAVGNSAPALGKAAVAIGVAASVAIPAGVAVEDRLSSPPPAAAEPAADAEVAAPSAPVTTAAPAPSSAPAAAATQDRAGTDAAPGPDQPVAPLGADDPVAADVTEPAPPPSTTTPAVDGSVEPTPGTEPPPPQGGAVDPDPDPTPAPEPAPPPPPGDLRAEMDAVEAGPRLDVEGSLELRVGDRVHVGTVSGKILVADDGDGTPPRFEGDLTITLDDGSTLDLRLKGALAASDDDTAPLTATFRLAGGAALGVEESGEVLGSFTHRRSGKAILTLAFPGLADEDDGTTGGPAGTASDGSSTADPPPTSTEPADPAG